jgi:transposase
VKTIARKRQKFSRPSRTESEMAASLYGSGESISAISAMLDIADYTVRRIVRRAKARGQALSASDEACTVRREVSE